MVACNLYVYTYKILSNSRFIIWRSNALCKVKSLKGIRIDIVYCLINIIIAILVKKLIEKSILAYYTSIINFLLKN